MLQCTETWDAFRIWIGTQLHRAARSHRDLKMAALMDASMEVIVISPKDWKRSSRRTRTCPLCSAEIKVGQSSVTNCFQHLAHRHPEVDRFLDESAVMTTEQYKHQSALDQARECKRKREEPLTAGDLEGQLKIMNKTMGTDASERINKAMLKWLMSNNVPLKSLESATWKEFIRTMFQMANTEVQWVPPSRRTVARALSDRRDKILLHCQDLMAKSEPNSCVAFHDGWTDALNRYWLLVCVRIEEKYFVISAKQTSSFVPDTDKLKSEDRLHGARTLMKVLTKTMDALSGDAKEKCNGFMSDCQAMACYQHQACDSRTLFKCLVHVFALPQQHLFLLERNSGKGDVAVRKKKEREELLNLVNDLNAIAIAFLKAEDLAAKFERTAATIPGENGPLKLPKPYRTKWQGMRDLIVRCVRSKDVLIAMKFATLEKIRIHVRPGQAELERMKQILEGDKVKWSLAKRILAAVDAVGAVLRILEADTFRLTEVVPCIAIMLGKLTTDYANDDEKCMVAKMFLTEFEATIQKHLKTCTLINAESAWWKCRWPVDNFWEMMIIAGFTSLVADHGWFDKVSAGARFKDTELAWNFVEPKVHYHSKLIQCLKSEYGLKKDKMQGKFTEVRHGADLESGMQECIQNGQQTFIGRDQGELIAEDEVSRWLSRDTSGKVTENDLKESYPLLWEFWHEVRKIPVNNAFVERVTSCASMQTSDKRFRKKDVEKILINRYSSGLDPAVVGPSIVDQDDVHQADLSD